MASHAAHPVSQASHTTGHHQKSLSGHTAPATPEQIAAAFKNFFRPGQASLNAASANVASDPFNPANYTSGASLKQSKGCATNDPTCMAAYTGSLSASGARVDQHMNGSIPYTFNPKADRVDPAFGSLVDMSSPDACMDCSQVTDEKTFLQSCVSDPNTTYAQIRFAQCSSRANKQINFDNGSRQPYKIDQRGNTQFNLTQSPEEAAKANSIVASETTAPRNVGIAGSLAANRAAATVDPLGGFQPAFGGVGNRVTDKL